MSNDLSVIPETQQLQMYQSLAKQLSTAPFFQKIGGEGAVLSIMLYARELGLPPVECLFGGMNVIQGKVEIAPRMYNKMIRKAGHKIEILEATDKACRIKGTRKDTGETYTATYTIQDAENSGLVRERTPWMTYRKDMIFKSCMGILGKRLFPDVISVAYIEGELSGQLEIDEEESVPVEEVIEIQETPEKLSSEQVTELLDVLDGDDAYRDRILKGYRVSTLSEIPAEKFEATLKKISLSKLGRPELKNVAPAKEEEPDLLK